MDKEEKEFAELIEQKTNKLAKELVHTVTKAGLQPTGSIVSIIKATAILLESYNAVGEDADFLEKLIVNMIKPARMEVREEFLPNTDTSSISS